MTDAPAAGGVASRREVLGEQMTFLLLLRCFTYSEATPASQLLHPTTRGTDIGLVVGAARGQRRTARGDTFTQR